MNYLNKIRNPFLLLIKKKWGQRPNNEGTGLRREKRKDGEMDKEFYFLFFWLLRERKDKKGGNRETPRLLSYW